MGRYARDGGSYESGYAEHAEEMADIIDRMMQEARTEEERATIRKMREELGAVK